MTEKKKILFVMNNLNVGGAEKALVSLLQVFDYHRYDVDLLLLKKEGVFLKLVPDKVNILIPPANMEYFDMPFSQVIKENIFNLKWNNIFRRIQFKSATSKGKTLSEREQFGWKSVSRTLDNLQGEYDVAIGFLEKTPNYFVIEKVNAKKKIGWIQNDYEKLGLNADFDQLYFQKLDHIILNSTTTTQSFKKLFPEFASKTFCIENVVSKSLISRLGNDNTDSEIKPPFFTSAGRLTHQKGFDLGIEACKILKLRQIDFRWLIMGIGEEQNALQKMIDNYELQQNITLIGIKENPYAYINKGLFYFHPSRFEGKSVVVDEVKNLCKPILLTDFPSAKDQINHLENGFICRLEIENIADALEKLITDGAFRSKVSAKLSEENWGTEEEVQKVYQLIEK